MSLTYIFDIAFNNFSPSILCNFTIVSFFFLESYQKVVSSTQFLHRCLQVLIFLTLPLKVAGKEAFLVAYFFLNLVWILFLYDFKVWSLDQIPLIISPDQWQIIYAHGNYHKSVKWPGTIQPFHKIEDSEIIFNPCGLRYGEFTVSLYDALDSPPQNKA